MKNLIFASVSIMVLFLGCAGEHDHFAAFTVKDNFEVRTEDFSKAGEPNPDYLPHVHPFHQTRMGGSRVLVGFIPFAEEYIEGVAYLVSEGGEVLDTLVLSYEDPPGYQVGKVDSLITLERFDGVIEDGGENFEQSGISSKLIFVVQNQVFYQKRWPKKD